MDTPEDDPHNEDRKYLMKQLYLMYQLQPRAGLTSEERRQKAAFLRYECGRLGVPIPRHLAVLHKGVHAHPDPEIPGSFNFIYDDPWDSPDGPPPLFPDEDFSDLDTEQSEAPPTLDEIEQWRRAYMEDDRLFALNTVQVLHTNQWTCEGYTVTYNGPPWWLVICPCLEPKPCFHMALVAEEAGRQADLMEQVRRKRIIPFPGVAIEGDMSMTLYAPWAKGDQ